LNQLIDICGDILKIINMKKSSISNFDAGLKLTNKQLVTVFGGDGNDDHDDLNLGKPTRPSGTGTTTGSGGAGGSTTRPTTTTTAG
jgi:hypothetical protein